MNDTLDRVGLHNDTVLAELLLDEDDLLGALDDEIAAGIEGAFDHAREFCIGAPSEDTLIATEHDGEAANGGIALYNVLAACVVDGGEDGSAVSDVAQAALVRGDLLVDSVGLIAIR